MHDQNLIGATAVEACLMSGVLYMEPWSNTILIQFCDYLNIINSYWSKIAAIWSNHVQSSMPEDLANTGAHTNYLGSKYIAPAAGSGEWT